MVSSTFPDPGTSVRTLRIDVFTLFPGVIDHYVDASILGRARGRGQLDLRTHDVREAATDPHRSVDDAPFGGGAGMVIGPEPVFGAVERVAASPDGLPRPLVLLSPSGRRFDQRVAEEYAAQADGFSLLCGRYEGVDQRIADHLVDEELSVGDFVLAGGELAALVVVEAVVRLLPGVLGNDDSVGDESFSAGLLEYPQYTRPAEFRGWPVPDTLLSGDHARIARWRRLQALVRTMERRPDLIADRGGLTGEEVQILVDHGEVRLLREHGYDW
jgi:tRNA (guanine37-N1)-methyltransferase